MERIGRQVSAIVMLVLALVLAWKFHQQLAAFISGFLIGMQSS